MASNTPRTFSESWYPRRQPADLPAARIQARRQNFRGERWMVLENPFNNQFFRLRPAAYEFVARLRPERTVQEVWQECLDRFPEDAPSQESVIQLLSQLYFANLLQYDLAADSAQLFERFKKRRQREFGLNLLNIMFMRFPVLDPDRFLVRALPIIRWLISPLGAVLWCLAVGLALKVAAEKLRPPSRSERRGACAGQSLSALPCHGGDQNLPRVRACLFLPALWRPSSHHGHHADDLHSHAVRGCDIELEFPWPMATFARGRRGHDRGDLFRGPGDICLGAHRPGVIHSLAYNIIFVASVLTVIFNANPLLRFDGYYILSDLVEIPNLNQRALQQLRHLAEHYLLGVKKSHSPANNRREAAWFTVYGITSGIYRVVVFGGVLFAVADKFLLVGLVMALVCLVSWVTVPVARYIRYLSFSPQLERVRLRALAVTTGIAVVLAVLLTAVPMPYGFRAPGVIKAAQRTGIVNETAGRVEALLAKPGATVLRGQALLTLTNPELELELAEIRARLDEANARLRKSMKDESADTAPLIRFRDSVGGRLKKLEQDAERLIVRAPHDGIWVAPGIEDFVGRWLNRGNDLGLLVNPSAFEFVSTVMQADADALFGRRIRSASVQLYGDAGVKLPVTHWRVIPGEQKTLPSAALGWKAGGEVPLSTEDNSGNKAEEPFFEVLGQIQAVPGVVMLDGRSGMIRFSLKPEPLLPRWSRRIWQLFQKRYQV